MANYVITIGREFGSGGRAIAKMVAEHFNIKCYDKEIISLASEESGLHENFIAHCDEKAVSSLSFAGGNNFYFPGGNMHNVQIKAYFSQFDAIKKVAKEGPCVIVGRVADHVLKNEENKITIFISADRQDRVLRVMEYENISERKAEKLVDKNDKNRAKYYNFFSNKKWGEAKTYDLCVNSSKLGIDGTADFIIEYVKSRLQNMD
ncbi:MAG: cytidylate kinase-like family protein [Clostridia bacterium]|nr:cytidylate kinase-like family protein [Clostridia bacterium]